MFSIYRMLFLALIKLPMAKINPQVPATRQKILPTAGNFSALPLGAIWKTLMPVF